MMLLVKSYLLPTREGRACPPCTPICGPRAASQPGPADFLPSHEIKGLSHGVLHVKAKVTIKQNLHEKESFVDFIPEENIVEEKGGL